jgi:hypothetical protein
LERGGGQMQNAVDAPVARLLGDAVLSGLLDQRTAALVPVAVARQAARALASLLRCGRRVRLLMLGERRAPVTLALLGAPAAAASPAPACVLSGWLRLSAAIAASLDRRWLRVRAWASARLLGVLRTANWDFWSRTGTVQLLADELDDDLADELGDGAAQLVPDERLERLPGRRGHVSESRGRVASRTPGRFPRPGPLFEPLTNGS